MNGVIELKDNELLCMKRSECEVVSKADDPDAPIIARVSTKSLDSDGDIVHQVKNKKGLGWVLEHFNKHPVIVWSHDFRMPSLADPATKAKIGPDSTFGRSLFLDPLVFDAGDDFAMHLDGKIRRGVLAEFSVSFIGKIWEYIRDKENNNITGREFFESELIETSPVNRGANPDTDVMAKRLLGSAYVARKLETGGDHEAKDAIEEMEALHEKIAILTTAMKTMGDDVSGCQDAIEMINNKRIQRGRELGTVAGELLKDLKKIGTAHE